MLVMAFTIVGSAVQLPGVGGGSQVASFLAYTAVFGVEKEAAAAASIVLWLITFAACSLAGVPLLIHEGLSLGKLKEMAERKPFMDQQRNACERSEEHTSELQSHLNLVCRLLLEKKKNNLTLTH